MSGGAGTHTTITPRNAITMAMPMTPVDECHHDVTFLFLGRAAPRLCAPAAAPARVFSPASRAVRSRRASLPRRPTSCTPMGMPSSDPAAAARSQRACRDRSRCCRTPDCRCCGPARRRPGAAGVRMASYSSNTASRTPLSAALPAKRARVVHGGIGAARSRSRRAARGSAGRAPARSRDGSCGPCRPP